MQYYFFLQGPCTSPAKPSSNYDKRRDENSVEKRRGRERDEQIKEEKEKKKHG